MRSVGFTEVFVLHKNDLQVVLAADPSLRWNLVARATKLVGELNEQDVKPDDVRIPMA